MKDFLSPMRLIIIVSGIFLFILLLLSLIWIDADTIWGGLIINLAASSLIIAITASLVEYLIDKDRRLSVQKARKLAEDDLGSIDFSLRLQLAALYGFRPDRSAVVHQIEKPSQWIKAIAEDIDDFAKKIDFAKDSMVEGHVDGYVESLEKAKNKLNEVLILSGFALSDRTKGFVLELSNQVASTIELLSTEKTITRNKDYSVSIFRATSPWIYKRLNELREVL